MVYSRVKRRNAKKKTRLQIGLGLLTTGVAFALSNQSVNTDSYVGLLENDKLSGNINVTALETPLPLTAQISSVVPSNVTSVAKESMKLINNFGSLAPSRSVASEKYSATVQHTNVLASYTGVLANGNTAGVIGSEAAAEMAARTGVPQQTWEYIIARESNGNPNIANPSGASGLFQTMPGWGSTATVEDQINAAENAYRNQGLAAWGL